MRRPLPDGIERADLLHAIALLNEGAPHAFAESTGYDVLHEGQRHPPKAVVGVAAELVTGERFRPADFSGGVDSACFRVLERRDVLAVTNGGQRYHGLHHGFFRPTRRAG